MIERMKTETRIWVSPEQAEALNTPIDGCRHDDKRYLALITSKENRHGVLVCGVCGNSFKFLGHTTVEVTYEAKALEINVRRNEGDE